MHPTDNDAPTDAGYGGISWSERSRLSGLRAVLDSADVDGKKNKFIDILHSEVVEEVLKRRVPIKRALDFGCGIGRLTPLLARYANEVDGVDRTSGMLEIARKTGALPSDRLHLCQTEHLPFAPATFDFVLSVYVFSCIPNASVSNALREIRRVADADCCLMLIEQVAAARGLTRRNYEDILREAGFRVTSMCPVRKGSSPLVSVVSKRWFPTRLIRSATRVERHIASLRSDSPSDYYDYAIVAQPV